MNKNMHRNPAAPLAGAIAAALTLGLTALSGQTPNQPYSAPQDNPPSNQPPSDMQNSTGRDTRAYGSSNKAKSDSLSFSDRHFIRKAAEMNNEEVVVSRVAAQSVPTPGIRDFASQMVTAHEKVNADLMALATRDGVNVKTEDQNKIAKDWTDEKPAKLEKDYIKKMESAHKKLISMFESAAKSDNPDIAAFAAKYLPDLRNHYMHAQSLASQASAHVSE